MVKHSPARILAFGITLTLFSVAAMTTTLLARKSPAPNPRTITVFDNTLNGISAQDYPADGKVLHELQGFRATKEGWRIVSVKGWLRPSPSDDPGANLAWRIVSASGAPEQTIEIQAPPGPIAAGQNYGIQIVYESGAYFDETDKEGRDVFRIPRYPENLPYLLPRGHAVVGADQPVVITEKDGRVEVMNENLTGESTRDSRGNEITILTRRIAE